MPHAAVHGTEPARTVSTHPQASRVLGITLLAAGLPRSVRRSPADRSAGGPRKLTLALELREPRQRLRQAEEPVGDIQLVLGLAPGGRDVQRPGGRDARLAGLDEFGNGNVDDTLTAGLGATNSQQAINLPGCTLTCGAREFVAEQSIDWIIIVTAIGRLGHFCLALHISMQIRPFLHLYTRAPCMVCEPSGRLAPGPLGC